MLAHPWLLPYPYFWPTLGLSPVGLVAALQDQVLQPFEELLPYPDFSVRLTLQVRHTTAVVTQLPLPCRISRTKAHHADKKLPRHPSSSHQPLARFVANTQRAECIPVATAAATTAAVTQPRLRLASSAVAMLWLQHHCCHHPIKSLA